MAAIFEPHRLPVARLAPRPDLRLVAGGRAARPVARPLVSPASVVAFVAIAVLVMVAFVAVGRGALSAWAPASPGPASSSSASTGEHLTVTVRSGDTLWSIARRLRPTGDIRPIVDQLAAANGGSTIAPGDQLDVPSVG